MKTITAIELKERLDRNEVLLVDVRDSIEYRTAYIENAHLIPLNEINIQKLPSVQKPIVVYCRSGKRSTNACAKLLKDNTNLDIFSLEGGITAWQNAGFNVQKSCNILPLERQIQVTVGTMICIAMLLGTYISSVFYVIPAFIGLGLISAGITGWCGIAKILSKMPWNK